ncbi:MAG TPA: cation diffusion facilitator family transporter [Kiloniellales bacterium]|nr:cation diffusion facilitator family transporter [Kiloniellales bacterium]
MAEQHHHEHRHKHGRDHSHRHGQGANEASIGIAALLTGSYMAAEVVGGILSGSLALIADAGHMLTDFASLSLAWIGFRLARRPADPKRSYGFGRFSVLVAFVNGIALFVIAAWIAIEAWRRLEEPVAVLGGWMFWIALGGLGVNVIAFLILRRGDRSNLNIRAAALHVLGDLLGSVAAIAASIVIVTTGWMPIDPILSVLVAVIILRSAYYVVRESSHILLEGTPPDVDVHAIGGDLVASVDGVEDVHHLHVWSITEERPMATLHARLRPGMDSGVAILAIKQRLKLRFRIDHATVEVEYGASCPSP